MQSSADALPDEHNEPLDEQRFIELTGQRIGRLRKRQKLSRRALSELSGLSQRYLVQLENGAGNISIGRLFQLARALDCPIEHLLYRAQPVSDGSRIAVLYEAADDQQQRAVRDILDGPSGRARRVCLIGLRGAGKSTLGKCAAEQLSVPFRELNTEIETLSAMPVDEMMALYGQEGYRRMEKRALAQIANTTDSILLAAAGGVVSNRETFDFLLQHFHTIWLKASPEEHMQRVIDQGDYRPMAGNPDAMQELRDILTRRESVYARAHRVVDTHASTLAQSTEEVVTAIGELAGPSFTCAR